METEMIEKCMLQPVNPLMVGQSQAVPKKLPLMAASGALKQFHSIPLNYLPASTYSLGYAPFQHHLGKMDADFKINRNMFSNDIWTMQDLSATDNLADPVR